MTTTAESNESITNTSRRARSAGIARDGLIGGVAAIVLAFLPLSTVLGGAVTGYLQAKFPDGRSTQAGAVAGAIAFLPHLVVGAYLVVVMGIVPPGIPPGFALVGLLGFGSIYTVGLGVLGGVLGAYIRREHIDS